MILAILVFLLSSNNYKKILLESYSRSPILFFLLLLLIDMYMAPTNLPALILLGFYGIVQPNFIAEVIGPPLGLNYGSKYNLGLQK